MILQKCIIIRDLLLSEDSFYSKNNYSFIKFEGGFWLQVGSSWEEMKIEND